MEFQYYLLAISGGLMAGSTAGWMLVANGRVAGASGMAASSHRSRSADAAWQAIFLLGLVAGGAALTWLDPAGLPIATVAPVELMVGAGLLLGFGARVSGRSTDGHGLWGIGRLFSHSGFATGCFSATGLLRNERIWRS